MVLIPERIKNFQEIEPPRTVKQLKRFLGAVAFLTKSCPLLQFKCSPLHEIAGSNKRKFEWSQALQESFDEIKEHILNSCLMAYPSSDPKRRIFLTTDASDRGFGAILTQENEFGIEKPLGFLSGTFKGSQINWPIRDKELYAFFRALEHFFDYLWLINFTFRTDNQCLKHLSSSLKNNPTKNQRLLRWFEFIMGFNFNCELIKGNSQKMAVADMLSRLHDNSDKHPITKLSLLNVQDFWVKNGTSITDFLIHQKADDDLCLAKKSKYWKSTLRPNSKIVQKDEIFYVSAKGGDLIMVPKSLEEKLIHFFHLPLHVSPKRMFKEMKSKFIFPKMYVKITEYVNECETCVAYKPDLSFKPSKSVTSTLPHPWQSVQSDIKGPLGLTLDGNRYIITFICELTRFSILRPLKSKEATSIISVISDIIGEYGPMLSLQTDNGAEYTNNALKAFLENLKITHKFSCPYRPQTNSHAERLNREIVKYFKIFESKETDWDQDLKFIQFSVNIQYNRSLGCSPWEAWHGWLPNLPSFMTFPDKNVEKTSRNLPFFLSQRIIKHGKLLASIYDIEKVRKDTNYKAPIDLPIGQRVLMYFPQPVGSSKMFQNWKTSFVVMKKLDNDSYLVASENDARKTYVVYRGRLKPIGQIKNNTVEKVDVSDSGLLKPLPEGVKENKGIKPETSKYNLRKTETDYRKFY